MEVPPPTKEQLAEAVLFKPATTAEDAEATQFPVPPPIKVPHTPKHLSLIHI